MFFSVFIKVRGITTEVLDLVRLREILSIFVARIFARVAKFCALIALNARSCITLADGSASSNSNARFE